MIDAIGNIVVFGVSHSGTTILTRMLGEMGWRTDRASANHAEDSVVAGIDPILVRGQAQAVSEGREPLSYEPSAEMVDRMHDAISTLAEPWCIKNPRFVQTLRYWWPVLGKSSTLLWIRRPMRDMLGSWRRRGAAEKRNILAGLGERRLEEGLEALFRLAEEQYAWWPGRKAALDYERLVAAVRLFNPDRGARYR